MDGRRLVRHDKTHQEQYQPVGIYFAFALICGAIALALPQRG